MSNLKVHYSGFDKFIYGDPCGCPTVTIETEVFKSTRNKDRVTCKFCLKSLKAKKKLWIAGGREK
jgi:hypothetical protein